MSVPRRFAWTAAALALGAQTSCTSTSAPPTPTPSTAGSPTTLTSRTPPSPHAAGPRFVAGARCESAQLRLVLTPGSNGAGGTAYMSLRLTNTSTVRCVTEGYPGLSVIDSSGSTVQRPARRGTGTRSQPVARVSIAPGQSGYVLWTSSDVTPSPDCPSPFHGTRLRVYPPDSTVALYAPFTRGFCDLGVGPVTTAANA